MKTLTGLAARLLRRREATIGRDRFVELAGGGERAEATADGVFVDADAMTQAELAATTVHLYSVLGDNNIDF